MWRTELKSLIVTLREMSALFFQLMWMIALMTIENGAAPPPAGQPHT